jgi:sec-independent protein translocase protein TatC
MAKRLRPIGHDDRLSVVDHLDELRSRLIVCFVVLGIAFGLCFWQSAGLQNLLNRALPPPTTNASNKISGLARDNVSTGQHLSRLGRDLTRLSRLPNFGLSPSARALLASGAREATAAGASMPRKNPPNVPITTGVGEPFTVAVTVAFYAAVLISLPLLLYELYAFVVPALNPNEKRVAGPVLLVAPVLFAIGVAFTYIVVLPHAVHFLQGYNSHQVDALVQAKALYAFEVMVMAAIGLAFEMPLLLLGMRAAGIIDGGTLTRHWRYAVMILAIVAAAMPGADPVTTGLEVAPLAILFIASIVLLKLADRRQARREAAELQRYPVGTVGGDGD